MSTTMNRYRLTAACFALVFLASGAALAHERIIMGTVATIHEQTIDVTVKADEATERKEEVVSVVLEAGTKYLKGRQPASRDDLKPGVRVVVTVDHRSDDSLVAKEIRLAPDERHDSNGHSHRP